MEAMAVGIKGGVSQCAGQQSYPIPTGFSTWEQRQEGEKVWERLFPDMGRMALNFIVWRVSFQNSCVPDGESVTGIHVGGVEMLGITWDKKEHS